MSSKTKIVVLRMKEVIYTGIFIGLALLLLILCFIMFRPAKKEASTSSGLYIPGLYSASLTLGNEQVNVEVTVDSDQILDVSLVHLNEAVSTMYPLMQPSYGRTGTSDRKHPIHGKSHLSGIFPLYLLCPFESSGYSAFKSP